MGSRRNTLSLARHHPSCNTTTRLFLNPGHSHSRRRRTKWPVVPAAPPSPGPFVVLFFPSVRATPSKQQRKASKERKNAREGGGRPGCSMSNLQGQVRWARHLVHSELPRGAERTPSGRQACSCGLASQFATRPHHQFPTVGFAPCLTQKRLHHEPWKGAKGRRGGGEKTMSLPHIVVTGTAHSTRDGVTARDGRQQKPNQKEGKKGAREMRLFASLCFFLCG